MEDSQPTTSETPPAGAAAAAATTDAFTPPSITPAEILAGRTYTHHSPVPTLVAAAPDTPCVLGIDEAGRGPVLGAMVYAAFYLPASLHRALLTAAPHRFDDSKQLTAAYRAQLMRTLCDPNWTAPEMEVEGGDDGDEKGGEAKPEPLPTLHAACGWSTCLLSPRAIAAGMLRPLTVAGNNLNAQAFAATVELIRGTLERGVNLTEVYVDTVGPPAAYQARLERVFPRLAFTVAKKADSLYPCVSAASVCAKVTRDVALDVAWEAYARDVGVAAGNGEEGEPAWGSGYPSDARCANWLKANTHPIFGWGNECRFSWGTVKDLLESKLHAVGVEWPDEGDVAMEGGQQGMAGFLGGGKGADAELIGWFGKPVAETAF